ncbi:DUF3846 domain-containing protein [Microbacterium sp. SL62]|uniref:DUF3846 domain-containing protein n=1 Tax=Microbacterium sp. SL62 TaxID=2995139 RepID=UPI002274DD9C|nr:DUF3846 domain-containing protein [Microbacterium sp. SL62]MCY1718574.1 DUF3846 domain-containing protein [Microbacterium sp. SL62]
MTRIRAYRVPADPTDQLELVHFDTNEAVRSLSSFVGGHFQAITLARDVTLWVNEDRSTIEPVWNQRVQTLWDMTFGAGTDHLVGQAVLTGGVDAAGETLGLTDAQLEHIEGALGGLVRVKIENTYEDGHESERTYALTPPEDLADLDDWWDTAVYDVTGDGHGAEHPSLGSLHDATVLAGPSGLVGKTCEFGG